MLFIFTNMRPHEIRHLCHKTIVLNGMATLPEAAVVVRSSGGAAAVVVGAAVLVCPSGGAVVVVDSLDDETPAVVVSDFTLEEAVETLADADASCSPLVTVVEATRGTDDCGGAEDIVADAGADVVCVDCVVAETTFPGGFVCVVLGTFVGVYGIFIVVVGVGVFVVVVVEVVVVVGAGVVSVFVNTSKDSPIDPDPGFFW